MVIGNGYLQGGELFDTGWISFYLVMSSFAFFFFCNHDWINQFFILKCSRRETHYCAQHNVSFF